MSRDIKYIGMEDKRINVPVVYLEHHQILLSRSLYAEAKQEVYCD